MSGGISIRARSWFPSLLHSVKASSCLLFGVGGGLGGFHAQEDRDCRDRRVSGERNPYLDCLTFNGQEDRGSGVSGERQ